MSFRRNLMLFTACTAVALSPVYRDRASAQTAAPDASGAPAPSAQAGGPDGEQLAQNDLQGSPSTTSSATAGAGGEEPTDVQVRRQQLLLRQKDVISAITEIGPRDIQAAGNIGSVQSLLQQSAPNVHVYQQGPGQNFPIISVRGVRGTELATTLDGVPTQDLLFGGQGAFETSNVGAQFNLGQIEGVTVFPGVAAPGTQGYGTTGGTLAYQSKKPTDERYLDVFGSIGSFGPTTEYGFEANSGAIQELDGLKTLLRYSAQNTAGYVNNTNAQYRDMLFAFDKPYDGGLSHVTGLVIYNNDFGYIQPQPTSTNLLDTFGKYFNPAKSEQFLRQDNDFLSVFVGDQTYISDELNFSGNLFYLHNNANSVSYQNPNLFTVAPTPSFDGGPNTSYYYFAQNPFNFFGNPGGNTFFGPGGVFFGPHFQYNPNIYGDSSVGYGLNAFSNQVVTSTIGMTPKFQVFLPFNNITIGALIARSKQTTTAFLGGTPDIPQEFGINQTPYNVFGGAGTNTRVIYQGYAQDRIDLIDNTLHIQPGITYEGVLSQVDQFASFLTNPLVDANGGFRLKKWNTEVLPYVGASYDFPYNISVYGSFGKSALYAPVSDFTLGNGTGSTTTGPNPAITTAWEGGVRYNTEDLLLNLDYFYQKIDRAFGFFTNPKTQQNTNSNVGIEEFKGIEADVKYKITPELTAFGNAGYLLAKYLQSYPAFTSIGLDQFGFAFKGQPISGVPDWTAVIGLDYETKNVAVEEDSLFVRVFTNYTGAQNTSLDLNPNQPSIGVPPHVITGGSLGAATTTNKALPVGAGLIPVCCGTFGSLSPYWLANAVIDYTYPVHYAYVKQVKFELNLQNIFNTHYFGYFYNQYSPFAGSYSASGPAFNDGLVGPPFSAQFTATVRF